MTAALARPSAYLSRASLAAELDMAESTVDDMVRRGVLPRPVRLSTGCVRWCWSEVETALASLKDGAVPGGSAAPADPYSAGVQNVARISEGRRGPS